MHLGRDSQFSSFLWSTVALFSSAATCSTVISTASLVASGVGSAPTSQDVLCARAVRFAGFARGMCHGCGV